MLKYFIDFNLQFIIYFILYTILILRCIYLHRLVMDNILGIRVDVVGGIETRQVTAGSPLFHHTFKVPYLHTRTHTHMLSSGANVPMDAAI